MIQFSLDGLWLVWVQVEGKISVFCDLLSGVAVANGINSTLLSQSKDADDWFI